MGRYITLEQLKSYAANDVDTDDDVFVEKAIVSAEKSIDRYCQRRFDLAGTTATARKFKIEDPAGLLLVDDFTEVTAITNAGTTVALGDVEYDPINGIDNTGESVPYIGLWLTSGLWVPSSTSRYPVTITAKWGWPGTAINDTVVQGALILGRDHMLARRSFGSGYIAVTADLGLRAAENRQVTAMLADYRRERAWGIA